jgi:RHS repeat-associated protein
VVYSYDSLNRISQAKTSTNGVNCWGEVYSIDAWGNLKNITGPSGMNGCNTEGVTNAIATNNQITGYCYDGAGNLLDLAACANQGAAHSFVYDAEGHLQSPPAVTTTVGMIQDTYFYDGNGNRVQKCAANPCTSASSVGTLYWRGTGGEVLSESTRTGNIQEEYIYCNGQRIARRDVATGQVHYYFSDHLGSASVITDSNGNIQQQTDYYPYGGIAYSSGNDPNRYKFTGKERDSESGLDYFGARHYASTVGRFMTPDWNEDPDPVPYADLRDPQSLNLYSYVRNNPMNSTDDDGHECTQDANGNIHCVVREPLPPEPLVGHQINPYYGMGMFAFENEEFGPYAWAAGGTLLAIGCYQTHCLSFLTQKNTNDSPPPADASSSTSKTASPNPDPTGQKPKPVQSGNSKTVSKGAAKALNKAFNKNLSPREWGRALEALKSENNVPNNFHGQIMSNGDFVGNGETIGNIGDYLP